jgi:hypothetical protein
MHNWGDDSAPINLQGCKEDIAEAGRCHSCYEERPIAGTRLFEGEGDTPFPVCDECMEGIDVYGEPRS